MTADAKARRLKVDGTFDVIPSLLTSLAGGGIDQAVDLVLVYDASADEFKSCTLNQLRVFDAANRLVQITATGNITAAAHEGRTCVLNATATLVTLTLPAATGTGGKYRFVVDTVNTSSYVFKSVVGADVMRGALIGDDGAGLTTTLRWAAGSTDDTLTLNGSTTGGALRGDWVEFEDIATDHWAVRGVISQSGTEATPFSDTVA